MLDFLIPLYRREGKSYLTIGLDARRTPSISGAGSRAARSPRPQRV